MVVFGKARRAVVAKLFADGANLTAAAFIFGPFVSGRTLSLVNLMTGFGLWVLLAGFAVAAAGKETS